MAKSKHKNRGARLPIGVSDDEIQKLAVWVGDAFGTLADRILQRGSPVTTINAGLVCAYGLQFQRVVLGETNFPAVDQLWSDLAKLRRKPRSPLNWPLDWPLDFVELSVQCTGAVLTVDEQIREFDLTRDRIAELQNSARRVADMTMRLVAMVFGASRIFPAPQRTLSVWTKLSLLF